MVKQLSRFLPWRLPIAAVLSLTLSAPAVGQAPVSRADAARLVDSLARAFVANRGAPGVSIAVVRGSDTLVMNGWGMADLENEVPSTARTVYRIGSITKQFTSAAVMQLVEQGKVKLDDPIGASLATLPAAWRGVTVRQLLNHTSGIPSYTNIGPRWVRRWGEEMSPDTLVALTAADTMWFTPGTSWRYDNSGYVLLGMLIEKLTGHSWAADIAERLATPLGLADTRDCATAPIIPRRASGYQPTRDGWVNAPYLAMSQPYAAGALCSTVADLATWDRALATGKVVTSGSYTRMTSPEGAAATGELKYGFGLVRDTMAGRTIVTHGGGINGFISANAWFPAEQLSVTVLSNSGAARTDALLAQVARAVLGVPLLRPPSRVAVSPDQLARYAGSFALRFPTGARDITFTVRGGELYGQLAGQDAVALIPYPRDIFGAAFDPELRFTFTMSEGRAAKVQLLQGGRTVEGDRK